MEERKDTYKVPTRNSILSPIFFPSGNCSCHISGCGRTSIPTSEMAFVTVALTPAENPTWQYVGTPQFVLKGRHERKILNQPEIHQRSV